MTVSKITPVNNYTGNGSTTTFDFDFLIEEEKELLVQKTNALGVQETLKLNIDYSIAETKNENGSYITFPIAGSSYSVCRVAFSEMPFVVDKQINICAMTPEEIEDAEEKPFFLMNTVHVLLIDKKKNKTYTFTIKAGFDYDGASINRLFWRIIGSKGDIKFKIAALIHDILCIHHEYVNHDRYFSTIVFDGLLYVGGTEAPRRWTMKHSVDNFQKFCDWEDKEKC